MKYTEIKCEDKSAFIELAAKRLISEFELLLAEKNEINIAISGGSTPIGIFKYLLNIDFNAWDKIRFYWVDERFVPLEDEANNAYNALKILRNLEVKGFHRIDTSKLNLESVIEDYKIQLEKMPKKEGFPYFDLILLGMGTDGHTASLFPDTKVLNEIEESVADVFVTKLDSYRITLTYPTILNAGKRLVLFGGDVKNQIFNEIRNQEKINNNYPIDKIYKESKGEDIYLHY